MKIFAADIPLGNIGGGGLGSVAQRTFSSGGDAVTVITDVISAVIGFMTIAAGIWLIFQIVASGISWITAGGDKNKLAEARDRLTNALIGMIIVAAAWAIVALAGKFLGMDIFITNPNILQGIINP